MEISLTTVMSFGKYKGHIVAYLLPDIESEVEYHQVADMIKYFAWIKSKTNHTLSKDLQEHIRKLLSLKPNCIALDNNKSCHKGDYGQSSCPSDYMGMGPADFGIPNC